MKRTRVQPGMALLVLSLAALVFGVLALTRPPAEDAGWDKIKHIREGL